jgi:hypothetical protein
MSMTKPKYNFHRNCALEISLRCNCNLNHNAGFKYFSGIDYLGYKAGAFRYHFGGGLHDETSNENLV